MGISISNELDRIASNQKTLLAAMPEMVLLVNINGSIEHMNPSAVDFFGDLCGNEKTLKNGNALIRNQLINLAKYSLDNELTAHDTTLINDSHIQYTIAPFSGYNGDDLYWLIIKDITENTRHKEELSRHQNHLESVLHYKINELKETQTIRKQLSEQIMGLKISLDLQQSSEMIIGTSRAMQDFQDMVMRVAETDTTILITGESGTGKELAANMIYESSCRRDKPFLKINCNTINDSLLESDLFGHEKGSFTGADGRKIGKFEVVDGGTIFLDEIGDISPRMQAALLRVLQNGEIFRVGGNQPIKVDVRIIAATNIDLAKAVQKGTFRLDLFYRLSVINLPLPPLRERKEDIPDLVSHFVRKYRKTHNKNTQYLTNDSLLKLNAHSWPGNIRELENVIQRAVLISKTNIITPKDLIFGLNENTQNGDDFDSLLLQFKDTPLKTIVAELEKIVITRILESHKGNVAKAAEDLSICKAALYEKLKRYQICTKELRNSQHCQKKQPKAIFV